MAFSSSETFCAASGPAKLGAANDPRARRNRLCVSGWRPRVPRLQVRLQSSDEAKKQAILGALLGAAREDLKRYMERVVASSEFRRGAGRSGKADSDTQKAVAKEALVSGAREATPTRRN